MKNLAQVVGLVPLLRKARVARSAYSDFEAIYSEIASDNRFVDVKTALERRILGYFDSLELPRQVTMYDKLLLSLRRKDLVASFNWDPLLAQAFFRHRHLRELPEMVYLHGNVAIGTCGEHDKCGFYGGRCGICNREFEQSRLLFPVLDKHYRDDPFIADQWNKLEAKLKDAYLVTIIGYAAPVSDKAAREIMHLAWNQNGSRTLADVEIVNLEPRRKVLKNWADFITRDHFLMTRRTSSTQSFRYPRRSCEALAAASLRNDPWRERPFPQFRRLETLERWCAPLIAAERSYYESNQELPRW